jgi:hypothetical protein
MKILIWALILLSAGVSFAQSDLPDKGSLSDIKGKTKIYIAADAINAGYINSELAKHKEFANTASADTAEFIVEYHTISTDTATSLQLPIETGQVDVYFFRDGKRVVVWSKGDTKGNRGPAASLFKQFLKDLAKTK